MNFWGQNLNRENFYSLFKDYIAIARSGTLIPQFGFESPSVEDLNEFDDTVDNLRNNMKNMNGFLRLQGK